MLVLKYLYRFTEPEPWDVVVFKNPQDNSQNYIKRLIGLPGESIEIVHGDVFFRKADGSAWRIRRKMNLVEEAEQSGPFDYSGISPIFQISFISLNGFPRPRE